MNRFKITFTILRDYYVEAIDRDEAVEKARTLKNDINEEIAKFTVKRKEPVFKESTIKSSKIRFARVSKKTVQR